MGKILYTRRTYVRILHVKNTVMEPFQYLLGIQFRDVLFMHIVSTQEVAYIILYYSLIDIQINFSTRTANLVLTIVSDSLLRSNTITNKDKQD